MVSFVGGGPQAEVERSGQSPRAYREGHGGELVSVPGPLPLHGAGTHPCLGHETGQAMTALTESLFSFPLDGNRPVCPRP